MQLTEEKLNELKALAKQATPGLWKICDKQIAEMELIDNSSYGVYASSINQGKIICIERNFYQDAAFITAASPDVVLALIEENERLREEMKGKIDLVAASSMYELFAEVHARAERLEKEADWLAARMKCDNAFTPEQEADCIAQNGPCAQCLRKAAKRAVGGEGA